MKICNLIKDLFSFKKFQAARSSIRVKWRKAQPSVPENWQIEGKTIDYLLNDMSTPDLIKVMNPPIPPVAPKFVVKDYAGGGHTRGTVQSQAANCFVTVANTLNFQRQHTDKPLTNWAGTSTLIVLPQAGQDLNAYYDRRTLSFFYFGHKEIGGTVYTADSSDIVAHELGHAILDSFRPDTWGAASLEIWSFHEAFADLTAMMNIMSHKEILEYVINQTGGDMRKENIVANLAEHVGQAIYKVAGGPTSGRSPVTLRNAINDFKYVNPGTLPEAATDDKLAAECHSFGRIFLGAFYDILVMMHEDIKSRGDLNAVDSLAEARDCLWKYTLKAIQNAPLNANFYESMAKTLLWADVTLNNWKYHDRMMKIFMDRNLMRPQLRMLSAPVCDNDESILKDHHKMTLKLGDHLLRAQSNNPLYDVEIEIPHDSVYLYDNNKKLVDVISCSDEDALMAGQDMITYLYNSNQVDNSSTTPFAVKNGKLVRTHFK